MLPIRKQITTKTNIKCPNPMTPTRVVVHNTYNDASAKNEANYMCNNNNEVSTHYFVDDVEIVQCIEENRNSWNAGDGNGKGNREGLSVEICYSKSGGEKFIQSEKNAAELIAWILKRYGWGIDRVTKHQDYSGKYCPHRTLDMGWERFLNMVREHLGEETIPNPTPEPSVEVPHIVYGVKTLNHGILPDVTDRTDFAGYANDAIVGVKIGVTKGWVEYRVHTVKGKWLGKIRGSDWNDYQNGWAGNGKDSIDAIQIYYHTDKEETGGKVYRAVYQVKPHDKDSYYPNVSDTNWSNGDGSKTAGTFGTPFTELKISLE